jgi:hypothetical protein
MKALPESGSSGFGTISICARSNLSLTCFEGVKSVIGKQPKYQIAGNPSQVEGVMRGIQGFYDYWLVALSVVIAILAAYGSARPFGTGDGHPRESPGGVAVRWCVRDGNRHLVDALHGDGSFSTASAGAI